ncbi:hypothetical protein [Pantoea sp. QMID4]|uniref:hypothetical protein n=1 Tax=Pantoea sp. QMID4 TaxID=3016793 RepID=UPI002554EC15|nr:hypothetical protein [Pantoea sp. QMID4]
MSKINSSVTGMLVTTELLAAFLFSYLILSDSIIIDQLAGCAIMILPFIYPVIVSIFSKESLSIKMYITEAVIISFSCFCHATGIFKQDRISGAANEAKHV